MGMPAQRVDEREMLKEYLESHLGKTVQFSYVQGMLSKTTEPFGAYVNEIFGNKLDDDYFVLSFQTNMFVLRVVKPEDLMLQDDVLYPPSREMRTICRSESELRYETTPEATMFNKVFEALKEGYKQRMQALTDKK